MVLPQGELWCVAKELWCLLWCFIYLSIPRDFYLWLEGKQLLDLAAPPRNSQMFTTPLWSSEPSKPAHMGQSGVTSMSTAAQRHCRTFRADVQRHWGRNGTDGVITSSWTVQIDPALQSKQPLLSQLGSSLHPLQDHQQAAWPLGETDSYWWTLRGNWSSPNTL